MKEQKEKKRLGLIIFLVIMMVGTSFSVIFYGFSPQYEKKKFNGMTIDIKRVLICNNLNSQNLGLILIEKVET